VLKISNYVHREHSQARVIVRILQPKTTRSSNEFLQQRRRMFTARYELHI